MDLKPYQIIEHTIKSGENTYKLLKNPYFAHFVLKYILRPRMFDEETDSNKTMRYGFLRMGGGMAAPEELRALRYMVGAMTDALKRVMKSVENKEPVVWVDWPVPSEVVNSFGLQSICPENIVLMSNSLGTDIPAFEAETAESDGLPADICSLNRMTLGAYLCKQIPQPYATVAASHPCDSGRSANQVLSYFTGVPAFVMDTPYGKDRDSVTLFERNTWELIGFMEKISGKKLDWDKLKEYVENINKFNHCLKEITNLHRAVPSPNLVHYLQNAWRVRFSAFGDPACTHMAMELYEIAKKRVQKPSAKLEKSEKIRVVTWDPPPAGYDYYRWMEKEFGAVIVADYLGRTVNPHIDTSSEESMIRGIAEDKLYLGMVKQSHGPLELITDELETIIDEFSPDCVIFHGHIGCKHNHAVDRLVKDVCKRLGVPVLFMQIDIFDIRHTPEKEVKKQIKEFFISNGMVS